MASKIRISTTIIHVPLMVIMIVATILICSNVVLCDDTVPVPADISQLNNWFNQNVGPLNQRKSELDPALVAAESNVTVIKVMQDGSGAFKSIGDAIKTIPTGNTRRVILYIGGGTYNEKIKIDRTLPFITFFGDPSNMPNITFGGTAQQFGTVDSATLIVESDYFMACNIMIANNAPRPDGKKVGAQAVALRISGDKASFYNCKLYGFQDTLCDDRNRHLFKDCLIQGTVDFIFGSGKSLYLNTELRFVGDGVIVAQARMSDKEDTGYSFVHCTVDGTGSGTGPGSMLGRAWMSHPKVVFAYCSMTNIVDPQGWSDNMHPDYDKTVFFGEYKNTGAGANVAQRKMSTQLTDANAAPFIRLGFIQASKWLLPPPTPKSN